MILYTTMDTPRVSSEAKDEILSFLQNVVEVSHVSKEAADCFQQMILSIQSWG